MTTKSTMKFLTAAELVDTYSGLTTGAMRDALAQYPTDHIYLVFKGMAAKSDVNPFPPSQWNSYDNLIKAKPDTESTEKESVDKTIEVKVVDEAGNPVLDKNGVQKTTRKVVEGEKIERFKRLRKVTNFNAQGKSALAFIVAAFTHEALMASSTIDSSDIAKIKEKIIAFDADDCEYRVAPTIFATCEAISDAAIKYNLPSTHGSLESKLNTTLEKYIKDSNVRHVVLSTTIKLIKYITISLASNLWHETKKITEDNDDVVGKGTTTSDKHIQQELTRMSNLFGDPNYGVDGLAFIAMKDFHKAVEDADKKKKDENKKKRDEAKSKKSSEAAKVQDEAKAATSDATSSVAASSSSSSSSSSSPAASSTTVVATEAPKTTRRRTGIPQ